MQSIKHQDDTRLQGERNILYIKTVLQLKVVTHKFINLISYPYIVPSAELKGRKSLAVLENRLCYNTRVFFVFCPGAISRK